MHFSGGGAESTKVGSSSKVRIPVAESRGLVVRLEPTTSLEQKQQASFGPVASAMDEVLEALQSSVRGASDALTGLAQRHDDSYAQNELWSRADGRPPAPWFAQDGPLNEADEQRRRPNHVPFSRRAVDWPLSQAEMLKCVLC